MAQQQARDEAGNIWNIDEAGNPVSLAQAAPQGGAGVVAPNPVQAQRQQADLGGAQLGNARTAQQIALDAAKLQTAPQLSEEELRSIRLDNARKEKELSNPVESKQTQTDRLSRLRQLAGQINRTQSLYNTGIGTTKGVTSGWRDYLPSDANARFDVAGNSLSQQGLAAFKVPGMGTVSDRDAVMFDRANLPSASTRDVAVDEQLRGIRARVDEEMKALGQPAVKWEGSVDNGPVQTQDQQPAAIIPGAGTPPQGQGPAGYDVGSVAASPTGGSGGGGFSNAAGVAMAKRLSQAYTRGAGVQELNKLLSDNGFQTFSDPASVAAIGKRGRLNFAPPVADDTRNGVGNMFGAIADSKALGGIGGDIGSYAISAADALTAGTLDNMAGGNASMAMDYMRQKNPVPSFLGSVTGGALGAGAAELGLARAGLGAGVAALGGDALYGAAYGAGSTEDGSRLLGAAGGGLGGLAGGAAGRGLARGVGSAFRGVQDANVQGLRAAGVPLTVGQTLGGTAKGVEDRLSGVPVLGGVVNARRLEGMQGFNRAAFDEALAPIGANTGGITGPRGIDAAQNATRQGYDNALNGVSVTRDPQFTADYNGAINQGAQVPRVGPEFEAWARSDLDPLTAQPQYDGATIQDFIQQTRGADFGNDAMGNLVGRSVTGAEDAMRGLVDRQAPAVMPALRNADQAYRQTQVLKDAVNRARNGTRVGETGTFAPSQLNDAAAANGKRFGGSQGTTRQPFFNLTEAGQSVLPNSVPDSGTAGRLFTQQALGVAGLGALGGGGGYAAGGEDGAQKLGLSGLLVGSALAAGGSRAAQRALVASLIDRPQVAIRLGTGIANRARIGGLFGAPMLASAGSSLATQ